MKTIEATGLAKVRGGSSGIPTQGEVLAGAYAYGAQAVMNAWMAPWLYATQGNGWGKR